MWRVLKEAITSSYRRSATSWHNYNVKSVKDADENISTRLVSLGWDNPKFSPSEVNLSASVLGKHIASSASSKGTRCDQGQMRFKFGHKKSVGLFNGPLQAETLQRRGFLCKAGLKKEAEEMEGKENYESEESSGSDEFEDEEIVDEGDFVGLVGPTEQEEDKLLASKELLWNRIARVRKTCPQDVMPVIHKWKEQGKELNKGFLITYITRLRKRARYKHALEISEWLVAEKPFELDALDHILRIDLTARVARIDVAEKLFSELPSEFKTSRGYSTLLMHYVKRGMIEKAEQVFEEIKKLGLLTSPFSVNQMIRLYHLKGRSEKIPFLIDQAKSARIQPDIFTYNILMDVEGKAGNIEAMEKILDEVRANPEAKLDAKSHGIVASAYISANLLNKAELALKRMESGNYIKTPSMYNALLRMYGQLRNAQEVERVWQHLKKLPRRSNYSLVCLLSAFTSLDGPEGAEKAFEDMEEMIKAKQEVSTSTSLKQSKTLLKIYENFRLDEKAEELRKDMHQSNSTSDVIRLHTSVEQLLKSDDLEKAYDMLKLNQKCSLTRPLFDTYFLILDKYAEKGDVKISEKMFEACRAARYIKNNKIWIALLKAYIKADVPAYGFRQRMFADRVHPNPEMQKLLNEMKQEAPNR